MAKTDTQNDIARIKATLERMQEYAWNRRYAGLRSLWEDCTMSLDAIERMQEKVASRQDEKK